MSLKSDQVAGKSQALESTRPGSEYQLCSLQALLPSASYLTSLSHVCEMVRIPASQVHDVIEFLHRKSSGQGLCVYPGGPTVRGRGALQRTVGVPHPREVQMPKEQGGG